ncbi:UNVERIFIED_CONTAM: hypothetical protein RMT77_019204 [Armadillidium vulgare]
MASHIQTLSAFDNWNLPLRIQRRGDFFSDDGFLGYRNHFETAAKDLLREYDLIRSDDSFKSYRRLRDRQLLGTDRTAKIAEESDKYKIVMDVEGFSDADLQVKISGPNEIIVEGHQEVNDGGTVSKRSFRRRFSLPGLALVQDSSSVLSSDNVLTVNIPKKIEEIKSESEVKSSSQKQTSEVRKEETNLRTNTVEEAIEKNKKNFSSLISDDFSKGNFWDLQIVPKKSFFDDSYFENVRQNFQQSVDEVMQKTLRRIDSVEDDRIFRKVRETKEENVQAISVTEDSKEHKIVLDVHGFSETDLKVRAVSENELLVEGCVEKKTEYTSCSNTFKRRFQFPCSVNIRESTSALSSEGILTIIVPKRPESLDYPIPVRSEASSHLQSVIKKEQEKQTTQVSDVQNSRREHVLPVVQESQTKKESNSVSTEELLSTYNLSDSQSLLNKLERTVKLCDDIDNRQQPQVPVDVRPVPREDIPQVKDTTQVSSQSSDIIKESQRLVDESAKLISNLSTIDSTTKEHRVPIQLDDSTSIQTTTVNIQHQQQDQQQQQQQKQQHQHQQQEHTSITRTTPSSRVIPITLKGSFYNDSVFEDARKSIEKEVKEAFTKFHHSSLINTEEEAQKAVKDESSSVVKSNQTTSTILDDDNNYKIVLDVYGFEEKELKVRVTGVNEISIEGASEKSKGGSVSKHSFHRTFQLPDYVDLERTSTALSEEGILTIIVPKKNKLLLMNKKSVPLSTQIEQELKSREIKPTLVVDSTGTVQNTKTETRSVQESDSKRGYIVPVSVEGETEDSSASQLTSQISSVSSKTSADLSQDILSTSTSCSSIDTQVEKKTGQNIEIQQEANASNQNTSREVETREIVTKPLFNLSIIPRGHFFDDSFFQDSRSMFETILRNKMNRFQRTSSFVDDLNFFKSLRDHRITTESQMSTLSEDDHYNKIVLDVHGFNQDDLKIRALSQNEIVVEGNTEEKTGNSVSRKSFRKHFLLPGSIDLQSATSALSSDGVLNIKVPKK